MRIRTIKPEFWSHPVSGRWPGELQALAIGLLNLADDDGYFFADPVAIRGALRPFDDSSTMIRRSLDELVVFGWIEVKEHPTHGPIGKLPTFRKHQRIDRPKPSRIASLYDESSTHRGFVDDRSLQEGKGSGKGSGNREGKPVTTPHPLQAIWNENRGTLPAWQETSKSRRAAADARWRERPSADWEAVVKRLAASHFACGANDRGWVAGPDFLLKPDTAVKVLEGRYDNRPSHGRNGAPVPAEQVDWTNVKPGEVDLS